MSYNPNPKNWTNPKRNRKSNKKRRMSSTLGNALNYRTTNAWTPEHKGKHCRTMSV